MNEGTQKLCSHTPVAQCGWDLLRSHGHMATVLRVCPLLWPRGPHVPVCYEGREVTFRKLALWGGSEEMGLKCLWDFWVCCAHIAL